MVTKLQSAPKAFLIAMGMGLVCNAAWAQVAPTSDLQRQVDDAFKEVISDVGSLGTRAKYASLLVQTDNYEGGIAALEGLLVNADAPANIRVELATLYYRIGSYTFAQAHLIRALADPRLDAGTKKQAQILLDDVLKRTRNGAITGTFLVGLHAQSNPTGITRENTVMSAGTLIPRDPTLKPKSDVDGLVWLKLDHILDLGMQNEASVVTHLVALANHYNSVKSYSPPAASVLPYDVATVGGTTGIQFKPAPEQYKNLTLRPYVIYGTLQLNGQPYFNVGGVGGDINYRISDKRAVGALYEYRRFTHSTRSDIVDSTLLSGTEHTVRLRGSAEVGVNKVVVGELGFTDRSAERNYLGFRGPEAKLAYVQTFANPISPTSGNWTATLVGSVQQRKYGGADPSIDAVLQRTDNFRRLAVSNAIPLAKNQYLQLQVEYTNSGSNVSNFRYTNLASSVNVFWNF